MLVTSLVSDYLNKTYNNNNNNTMVQSVDVPVFYNRLNMADELLSLKWNNHKSTFADVLSILRDQEIFVDVTLACAGKLYPAHKFVLSTCSEYFREMFTKTPCKHPIVFMKDVSGRDLEALLDFMYRGEVNVPQNHLASLIKTAEGLQVKGLAVPDEQQLNASSSFIRRNREISVPRPPPAPSVSPPPKRKRVKDDYTPVGALNMMYSNMSPHEINSPYDLSQKSSSSSNVSQSDAAVSSDRTLPMSPDQPPSQQPHQTHQSTASSSSASPDDARPISRASDITHRSSRSPPPTSSTTHPTPSSTPAETNGRDSGKEDSDPGPGPSGMRLKTSDGEEDEKEEIRIKEDITVDDEDDENDWSVGNGGCSDGGDMMSETSLHDCIPRPYSEASNSSLPHLDPALSTMFSKKAQHQQNDSTTLVHDSTLAQFDSTTNLLPDPINFLQCPICLKEFKVLGSLKRHYRSHINFKPFACDLCGKRFTLNQYLIEHRRTHTGERPYPCHVCGKSFAQTGTLYHHVKNVHHSNWVTEKMDKARQSDS